jgi:glycosyltransferase involved in cell wall biosynthesis
MSRDLKDIIESFGIVYIEASYFGKPVIAGKSGGTADAVVDGKTGYIIKYDNIKKLEKTILLLLKNKKLRDKLGEAGRKRVLKEFLWKNNVEKLLDLYNKKIKRKHF